MADFNILVAFQFNHGLASGDGHGIARTTQSLLSSGKLEVSRPFQFPLPQMGGAQATDLRLVKSFLKLSPASSPLDFFICGGAEVYAQTLPLCSDLFLTLVKREVEGDAFFPPFEDRFELAEEIRETPEFKILHFRRKVPT